MSTRWSWDINTCYHCQTQLPGKYDENKKFLQQSVACILKLHGNNLDEVTYMNHKEEIEKFIEKRRRFTLAIGCPLSQMTWSWHTEIDTERLHWFKTHTKTTSTEFSNALINDVYPDMLHYSCNNYLLFLQESKKINFLSIKCTCKNVA